MTISITLSQFRIRFTLDGLTFSIEPDRIDEGFAALALFLKAIIPVEMKEGKQIDKFIKAQSKITSLIKRGFELFEFEDKIKMTIELTPEGKMISHSTESKYTFDFKGYMDIIMELVQGIEENDEEETEEDIQYLFMRNNATYRDVRLLLSQNNLLTRPIATILADQDLDHQVSVHVLSELNSQLLEESVFQVSFEFLSEKDNEIEFNSRPTNEQLLEAINMKLETKISWNHLSRRMIEDHDVNLIPSKNARTNTCIKACEIYGFKAVCNFND